MASAAAWLLSAVAGRVADDPPREDFETFCPPPPAGLVESGRDRRTRTASRELELSRWYLDVTDYAVSSNNALICLERLAGLDLFGGATVSTNSRLVLGDVHRSVGRLYAQRASDAAQRLGGRRGLVPQEFLLRVGEGQALNAIQDPSTWADGALLAREYVFGLIDEVGGDSRHSELLPMDWPSNVFDTNLAYLASPLPDLRLIHLAAVARGLADALA